MKIADTLQNGWKIVSVGVNDESPMENHKGGEIAADNEACAFYVHETFLVAYGLDSIRKACEAYPFWRISRVNK